MLRVIARPSLRVVSDIIFPTDTCTFHAFFKSSFDVGHLPSTVSLNKSADIGAGSSENKSFILFLFAETKYSTLYYIPQQFFIFASLGVFIVTTSFFIFDRKPSGKLF